MKPSWIERAVIYQVNLRSLAAREPRNVVEAARERGRMPSPLAFLARHLEVVRRLGANVLYLMPPYPIGVEGRKGIGSPYAVRDFMAVDPEFGTLAELRALVRGAHRAGLRVILDITPNHTSRDHVWTRQHPGYYVRNADGTLFHDCDWTDTAKLDYRNPELRRAMIAVYDFWLGCLGPGRGRSPDGIDGFRLDMAHFINEPGFWDEATRELRRRHASRELLFLAECYGTANNLGLFARGINAAYDDDFYKVCQYGYARDAAGQSVVRLAAEASGNVLFSDKRMAFEQGGIAGAMGSALLNYEWALPAGNGGPWLARYTDNHDEGRGLYRFGPGAVRAVNALLFMAPRTLPFVLSGQEFGALNRPPIHERFGICDKGYRVADVLPERQEPGIELEGNVFARGRDARRAWFAFYRGLIRFRLTVPELVRGSFVLLDPGEQAPASERTVVAFERRLGRSVVRCAVNLGPAARTLAHAGSFKGRALYGELRSGVLGAFEAVAMRGNG